MTERSPYDGKPFYCKTCGLGWNEYGACEEVECQIETEAEAQTRRADNPLPRARSSVMEREMTNSHKYRVDTVVERDGMVTTESVGTYRNFLTASRAAKRAANTRADCTTYGVDSVAYVGEH